MERDDYDNEETDEAEHIAEWLNASKRALQEVWDNDEDAVYDNL